MRRTNGAIALAGREASARNCCNTNNATTTVTRQKATSWKTHQNRYKCRNNTNNKGTQAKIATKSNAAKQRRSIGAGNGNKNSNTQLAACSYKLREKHTCSTDRQAGRQTDAKSLFAPCEQRGNVSMVELRELAAPAHWRLTSAIRYAYPCPPASPSAPVACLTATRSTLGSQQHKHTESISWRRISVLCLLLCCSFSNFVCLAFLQSAVMPPPAMFTHARRDACCFCYALRSVLHAA